MTSNVEKKNVYFNFRMRFIVIKKKNYNEKKNKKKKYTEE